MPQFYSFGLVYRGASHTHCVSKRVSIRSQNYASTDAAVALMFSMVRSVTWPNAGVERCVGWQSSLAALCAQEFTRNGLIKESTRTY
jgi:hypothetical protein